MFQFTCFNACSIWVSYETQTDEVGDVRPIGKAYFLLYPFFLYSFLPLPYIFLLTFPYSCFRLCNVPLLSLFILSTSLSIPSSSLLSNLLSKGALFAAMRPVSWRFSNSTHSSICFAWNNSLNGDKWGMGVLLEPGFCCTLPSPLISLHIPLGGTHKRETNERRGVRHSGKCVSTIEAATEHNEWAGGGLRGVTGV